MFAAPARSRLSVSLLFATMGVILGSWAGRIPDLKNQTKLSDQSWGLVNGFSTLGSLLSLLFIATVVARVGLRRVALLGACLLVVVVPLSALSTSGAMLLTGLFVQGFAFNALSPTMNAQAVLVEMSYGRSILSGFHACFSAGQLLGGLLATLAIARGTSPAAQLALTDAVLGACVLATARWQPADKEPQGAAGAGRPRLTLRGVSPQLAALAAVAFLGSVCEATAGQWAGIFTATTIGAGPRAGATAYSCVAFAYLVGRLFGSRVTNRLGGPRLLRWAGVAGAASMMIVLPATNQWTAWCGFALFGFSCSCMLPTVFSLAGNAPGLTPAQGASMMVGGQWPAYLITPILVGTVASLAGLRAALAILVLSALAVAW